MKGPTTRNVVCPSCDAVNGAPIASAASNCYRCQLPLFTGRPVELSLHGFFSHVRLNEIGVLVEFWSPSDPRRLDALVAAAVHLEPHLRVARLNTFEEPGLGRLLKVSTTPTMALFRCGREVARRSGYPSASEIVTWARYASERPLEERAADRAPVTAMGFGESGLGGGR